MLALTIDANKSVSCRTPTSYYPTFFTPAPNTPRQLRTICFVPSCAFLSVSKDDENMTGNRCKTHSSPLAHTAPRKMVVMRAATGLGVQAKVSKHSKVRKHSTKSKARVAAEREKFLKRMCPVHIAAIFGSVGCRVGGGARCLAGRTPATY
jgi:hypothetical protein